MPTPISVFAVASPRRPQVSSQAALGALVAALFAILAVPAGADDGEARAAVRAALVERRPKTEVALIAMTITSPRGQTAERELRIWTRTERDGRPPAVLARFTAPARVKRTGLLSVGGPEGGQWIFLPRAERVKRVASSERGGSFAGSDFSYDDLSPPTLDAFAYAFAPDAEVDGVPCRVVTATAAPAPAADSAAPDFPKRTIFLRKEDGYPIRVDFHDAQGAVAKRYTASGIAKVGEALCPKVLLMQDLRTGGETRIEFKERTVDEEIPERMFTPAELERGG